MPKHPLPGNVLPQQGVFFHTIWGYIKYLVANSQQPGK